MQFGIVLPCNINTLLESFIRRFGKIRRNKDLCGSEHCPLTADPPGSDLPLAFGEQNWAGSAFQNVAGYGTREVFCKAGVAE